MPQVRGQAPVGWAQCMPIMRENPRRPESSTASTTAKGCVTRTSSRGTPPGHQPGTGPGRAQCLGHLADVAEYARQVVRFPGTRCVDGTSSSRLGRDDDDGGAGVRKSRQSPRPPRAWRPIRLASPPRRPRPASKPRQRRRPAWPGGGLGCPWRRRLDAHAHRPLTRRGRVRSHRR